MAAATDPGQRSLMFSAMTITGLAKKDESTGDQCLSAAFDPSIIELALDRIFSSGNNRSLSLVSTGATGVTLELQKCFLAEIFLLR